MKHIVFAVLLPAFLAGCGGSNPFEADTDTEGDAGSATSVTDLPGTASPGIDTTILRYESDDEYTIKTISYDSGSDTLLVSGLPFDGADAYVLDAGLSPIGPDAGFPQYNVYVADPAAVDDDYDGGAGTPITQDDYIAIYGTGSGTDPKTSFVVVRTGSYLDYGFGGFVIQRNVTNTVIPTTGQANYSGNYAGIRVFEGISGAELVTGDMTMEIDFAELADDGAVRGSVTGRETYTTGGVKITDMPSINWVIAPAQLDGNGEFMGNVFTLDADDNSTVQTGTYYAVLAGEDAEEIAGVIVLSGTLDVDSAGVDIMPANATSVQETGGFILDRLD
ncbi:factor H binding protein domain-containing protein [Candidatus Halocynthiibacter alkanivorans]|uniref:factor H binding protein domain-containing protein n=1 Tax=Candidatus Halocynthiibacter alkanivorans TaxID=2267619 RepID=UPI00109D66EE|nr:factor H binding protein domain-containing protein [Candidatus Halocynthiibacter alkanivorans]